MGKDDSSTGPPDARAIEAALRNLLSLIPDDATIDALGKQRRSRLRTAVMELRQRLRAFQLALDPIRYPEAVFDPSDPHVIGRLIAETLLAQPRAPRARVQKFYGSGVYAIYYRGDFDAYSPVSGTETPLYIGKVDPATPDAITVEQQGTKLYERLVNDHAKSIRNAENLDLDDFDRRHLVVKSAWQSTAETYLIERFQPVWNNEVGICYGIGKHGDSASTRGNTRSPWDELHPGREWAWREGNKPNPRSTEDIKKRIAEHYERHPPERRVSGGLPPSPSIED